MFWKIVLIRKHERGLLYRDGILKRLLGPGRYWRLRWVPFRRESIEIVSVLDTLFRHPNGESLIGDPVLADAMTVVDLADSERALVWADGRLLTILGPGRHGLWNEPYSLEVERFDVNDGRFRHEKLDMILRHPSASAHLDGYDVGPSETLLVYRNGRLLERVGQGRHVYFKGGAKHTFKEVDLRERTLDVSGQEIMTNDKVTLRVNLVVTFVVKDPELALTASDDYVQSLYREAQLLLRAAIGTRKLDDLLVQKEAVGESLRQELSGRATALGLTVRSVGLRDIVLPGDIKTILNSVILAEKRAQSELIRRREEVAAARSQANTAKLLAENPVLARMKELELLRDVLEGTKATFVLTKGDLAEQIRSLVGTDSS